MTFREFFEANHRREAYPTQEAYDRDYQIRELIWNAAQYEVLSRLRETAVEWQEYNDPYSEAPDYTGGYISAKNACGDQLAEFILEFPGILDQSAVE